MSAHQSVDPDRTYLAGSDRTPPEMARVPLDERDFESAEEYHAVMAPWQVTDVKGRVLPGWLESVRVFERTGRITPGASALPVYAGAH